MEKLNWNQYFLALAKVAALRSKDPNTKVGAVLVNEKNRVVGMGYNGMPKGMDDLPWGREGDLKDTKYPYVVHAEMNAILNSEGDTDGTSLYVSLFPCSNCAKFCVQAGIKKIYYASDKYADTEDNATAKRIFNHCGIELEQLKDIEITIK